MMRTRSKTRSETVDRAGEEKKGAEKRKRKDDDPAAGDAADRTKRCKTQCCADVASASQPMASRTKSPPKKKSLNPAHAEIAAESLSAPSTSENGDAEVFAMTLEKFVGALRKRGAADRSSPNLTGERSCASFKKSITSKDGTVVSPVLIQPGKSSDRTHTLDDQHGRDNERSPEGGLMEPCRSSLLLYTGVKHHGNNTVMPTQGGSVEQCSFDSGSNVITSGASTHFGEDGLQVIDVPLSPEEVAGIQCQLHEEGCHHTADATLAEGKTEKRPCRKKRGTSLVGCLKASIQGEQNEAHMSLKEQPVSCPRSGKSKCRLGKTKQLKSRRRASIGTRRVSIGSRQAKVSQQQNSCHSRKRLNAAKSRWTNLLQSILSSKIVPEKNSTANSKNYKTLPNKQRRACAAVNALATDQRLGKGRMRQKVHKQQLNLLKRMRTWLTEAKFSQVSKEKNSTDIGEEFIMTEDERFAFVRAMVQSCQKDPNMRTDFLESVRRLMSNGLMQAAASNLLLQGPCEEAQNVMNAWADFKEQSAIMKTLPMNLLQALNELHEKRGDLLDKLSMPDVLGICTLSRIDEKTWKFQLPVPPLEDSLLPRNSVQDTAA